MNTSKNYLDSSIKEFRKLKELADKAIAQVKDEDYFTSPNEDSNSIAVILKHMGGNMLSRWTDFLTSDGEKEWRNRDEEFEEIYYTDKDDILDKWNKGWTVLFSTLESLTTDDLSKDITIRGEKHNVIEAINRQLTHYGYHTGQIVYLSKMLAGGKWQTLSVAKGGSKTFNSEMFKKHKK